MLLNAISLPSLQNKLAGENKCSELNMENEVSYLYSSSEVLNPGFMLELLGGLSNTDYQGLHPEIVV